MSKSVLEATNRCKFHSVSFNYFNACDISIILLHVNHLSTNNVRIAVAFRLVFVCMLYSQRFKSVFS